AWGGSLERPRKGPRFPAIQPDPPPVGAPAARARRPRSLWTATWANGAVWPHRQRQAHHAIERHRLQPAEEAGQTGASPEGPAATRVIVVAGHVGLRLTAREPQLDRLGYTRRRGGASPQPPGHPCP